jgi:hypothetical protein
MLYNKIGLCSLSGSLIFNGARLSSAGRIYIGAYSAPRIGALANLPENTAP